MRKRILSLLIGGYIAFGGLFGCGEATGKSVDIYMPDGAPALALAYAMSLDTDEDDVNYRVVAAETIAAYVSGKDEEKNADVCVLPVNLAAKLLGGGERYRALGVVTHGNLFLLGEGKRIGKENAQALKGKTIGVVQLANVPGLVTKAAFLKLGLSYQQLSGGAALSSEKVNLKAAQPLRDLKTLGVDYLVAPSPVAEKLGLSFAGNLQELYGDGEGYPQAVLVAKNGLIEERGEWIESFLEKVEEGARWLETAESETVYNAYFPHLSQGLSPAFSVQTLTRETVKNANVYFTSASESKEEIEKFLLDLTEVGAGEFELADGFFYEGR